MLIYFFFIVLPQLMIVIVINIRGFNEKYFDNILISWLYSQIFKVHMYIEIRKRETRI
jgi:hypothetical protein